MDGSPQWVAIYSFRASSLLTSYSRKGESFLALASIAFSSSLVPYINQKHPERCNVVVFNYQKCFVKSSNLISITGIDIESKQIDDDVRKIDVRSFIGEALDEIHQQQMAIINQQNNFIKRKI